MLRPHPEERRAATRLEGWGRPHASSRALRALRSMRPGGTAPTQRRILGRFVTLGSFCAYCSTYSLIHRLTPLPSRALSGPSCVFLSLCESFLQVPNSSREAFCSLPRPSNLHSHTPFLLRGPLAALLILPSARPAEGADGAPRRRIQRSRLRGASTTLTRRVSHRLRTGALASRRSAWRFR